MREYLDDRLSRHTVFRVVVSIHRQHQVSIASLYVHQSPCGRFQLDDKGYIQLLTYEFDEIDVITHSLTIGIEEGIRPEIPRILIDQRMLIVEDSRTIVGLCVHRRQHQ